MNFHDPNKEKEIVSYHEAAHVVFYHDADIEFDCVTAGLDGGVWGEPRCNVEPSQALEMATMIFAAEGAVHKAEHGTTGSHQTFEGFKTRAEKEESILQSQYAPNAFINSEDSIAALRLLKLAANAPENPYGGLKGCYEEAISQAYTGVEAKWPEIEILAGRLLAANSLSAEECAKIIESARRGEES